MIPQDIEQGQIVSSNMVATANEGYVIVFSCHNNEDRTNREKNATCSSTGAWNPAITCVIQGIILFIIRVVFL